MSKRKAYAYRIIAPPPHFKKGGYLDTYLQQMWNGGGLVNDFINSPQYKAIDTSNVNLPKSTSVTTQQKTNGMGIASGIGAAAGGIFSALASGNRGSIAPDTSTQQTVDALLSNIPFYSVGNSLGDWAATDYKNIQSDQNSVDFGKFTDPGKYDVASTIGGFLGPDNLISGLSGEGWTASQRRNKIEEQTAPQRRQIVQQKNAQLKQREINAGLGGRYFDQNQMMMAAMGGALPGGYYVDDVLGSSMQMGGPISSRFGYNNKNVVPMSNYNSGIDIYEDGGELEQLKKGGKIHIKPENRGKFTAYKERTGKTTEEALHSSNAHVRKMANFARNAAKWKHEMGGDVMDMEPQGMSMNNNPRPQITEYGEGGRHFENQSGYGGIPVDSQGNKVIVSASRPVASVEEGEISWFNPKTKSAYVFSNKIHI